MLFLVNTSAKTFVLDIDSRLRPFMGTYVTNKREFLSLIVVQNVVGAIHELPLQCGCPYGRGV